MSSRAARPDRPTVPAASPATADAPDRVLAAATSLFAERGFAGTTIRELAEHAGVNVATGHYHFGSKRALYLAAARAQFEALDARLAAEGALPADDALAGASRRELEDVLQRRIRGMLGFLLGPPPSPHGALMIREMCDPSDAMPVIVREFVLPQKQRLLALVARLAPKLERREVEQCCFSIVAQIFFQRLMLPALPTLMGVDTLPRDHVRRTAAHVAAFSLAGIDAANRAAAARRRARNREL